MLLYDSSYPVILPHGMLHRASHQPEVLSTCELSVSLSESLTMEQVLTDSSLLLTNILITILDTSKRYVENVKYPEKVELSRSTNVSILPEMNGHISYSFPLIIAKFWQICDVSFQIQ